MTNTTPTPVFIANVSLRRLSRAQLTALSEAGADTSWHGVFTTEGLARRAIQAHGKRLALDARRALLGECLPGFEGKVTPSYIIT